MLRRAPIAVAALVAVLAITATALASALVVVKVRNPEGEPADGHVRLEPKGDGETHSCDTQGGTCKIDGVSGGRYDVTLDPEEGDPPPPRTVMIPPSGRVELIVSSK
jgi:hypothetical protein